jgi:hypothetical protein
MKRIEIIAYCPFCDDFGEHCDEYDKDGILWHYIMCASCESCSGKYKSKSEAIKKWNKRFNPDDKTTL